MINQTILILFQGHQSTLDIMNMMDGWLLTTI